MLQDVLFNLPFLRHAPRRLIEVTLLTFCMLYLLAVGLAPVNNLLFQLCSCDCCCVSLAYVLLA